jgi:hypothetical protein
MSNQINPHEACQRLSRGRSQISWKLAGAGLARAKRRSNFALAILMVRLTLPSLLGPQCLALQDGGDAIEMARSSVCRFTIFAIAKRFWIPRQESEFGHTAYRVTHAQAIERFRCPFQDNRKDRFR